ncbi:MAG TPA: sigma-70 family RNA polymerase sigma factor [Anaerolineaceae bacterium]|nr:sigma-70 family RNA polymerase sigma factor [Anaerolineaceae bacterium]
MKSERFEELLSGCRTSLERFVYYRIPDRADAEDLLSQVYLRVFEKRDCLSDEAHFKPWVLQIARNLCHDYFRERFRCREIEWQPELENAMSMNRYGRLAGSNVRETLDELDDSDRRLLMLYYFRQMPLCDIAQVLGVPVGTVKSRLFTARGAFKRHHLGEMNSETGAREMKKLPEIMPDYTIVPTDQRPFNVRWEEIMGWLIVPRLGEKLNWALYDWPERQMTLRMKLEVTGKARVHGIEGVRIMTVEHDLGADPVAGIKTTEREFIAQLTESHCRYLAESHLEEDVRVLNTFLDGDDFMPNWGFGKDNQGNEVNLSAKGLIKRDGDEFTIGGLNQVIDVIGRFRVEILGKVYDTIGVMDVESYDEGVATEQFLDKHGRTVLWRRFNRDDWHVKDGKLWSQRLPENQRYAINGQTYVHWYDCISDYIL